MTPKPETLMLRYQQGDATAFDALYLEYAGRVRAYLLSRLRNAEQADEVLQATFLKLHRARHQYNPDSPFAPWLFTITKNAMTDALRSETRNPARPAAEDASPALEAIAAPSAQEPPNPSEAGASRLIAALDSSNRELLEWRYLQELSFDQIAARLEVSGQTARQRVSRAIRKLRKLGGRL